MGTSTAAGRDLPLGKLVLFFTLQARRGVASRACNRDEEEGRPPDARRDMEGRGEAAAEEGVAERLPDLESDGVHPPARAGKASS